MVSSVPVFCACRGCFGAAEGQQRSCAIGDQRILGKALAQGISGAMIADNNKCVWFSTVAHQGVPLAKSRCVKFFYCE